MSQIRVLSIGLAGFVQGFYIIANPFPGHQ